MKFITTSLLLSGLLLACQPRHQPPADAEAITRDTIVVDDDTLESTAGHEGADSTIVATVTVPEAAALSPNATGASPDNFYIIPGERVGPITATATESSLIQTLGATNVTHEAIELGEGDTEPGTTLFKGTANEVHILWKDKKRFESPEAVLIQPTGAETKAVSVAPSWLVNNGLAIGATLKEVEKLNGRPFRLYGFGQKTGGSFADAAGGKLQNAGGANYLSFTFSIGTLPPAQAKLLPAVSGDREFSSALPAMQQLNPTVETILVRFR